MNRALVILLVALLCSTASASSWRFDVNSKAEAMQRARQTGVGFDDNGNERNNGKDLRDMFTDWCNEYGLASPNDQQAFRNFKANMKEVRRINMDASIPYWAAGNPYSHLSLAQFTQQYLGSMAPNQRRMDLEVPATGATTITQQKATPMILGNRKLQNNGNGNGNGNGNDNGNGNSFGNADTPSTTGRGKSPKLSPSPRPSPIPSPVPSPLPSPVPSPTPSPVPSPTPSPVPSPTPSPVPSPTPSPLPSPSPAPGTTVNWVTRGMVTPIRNQGGCGSCWAFAATALVESMYLMSGQGSVSSLDISEQQVVSCVTTATSPYPSNGCGGGYLNYAIDYYAWSAVNKDTLWPYTGTNGVCNTANIASPTSGNAIKTASGSVRVSPSNDQAALKAAVLQAPVGFLMMVDSSFQNYRGGVYSSTTCTTQVNHAMLLVGVDFDASTNQWYWLVKNSWGTWWGESGYIRVAMTGANGTGMCGMYQWAFKAPAAFSSAPLS